LRVAPDKGFRLDGEPLFMRFVRESITLLVINVGDQKRQGVSHQAQLYFALERFPFQLPHNALYRALDARSLL
jgi:hypothetical protein